MNRVHDAVVGEEPHFVAPFLGITGLGVGGGVVVDEMRVENIAGEGGVKFGVCLECGEGKGRRHCGWMGDCWFGGWLFVLVLSIDS
jgi:hypothetical protein